MLNLNSIGIFYIYKYIHTQTFPRSSFSLCVSVHIVIQFFFCLFSSFFLLLRRSSSCIYVCVGRMETCALALTYCVCVCLWVIYTQLSGTRVAINIFLIAWTLISKSIDVAFAEAVVVVVGPIVTAVTIAVVVGFIVPVVVVQLLLLFVKYEPSIKSWDGTFVVTDFSSKFFGRFSWPEYLMSYWWKSIVQRVATATWKKNEKKKRKRKREQK